MSIRDRVAMVSLGRSPDPLLEEVIGAEGCELVHHDSIADLTSNADVDSYFGAVLLIGQHTGVHTADIIRRVSESLPNARIIASDHEGYALPDSSEAATFKPEDVLWIRGEICSVKNVERIRRFLRGEGYKWASDLGPLPMGKAAFPDSGAGFTKEQANDDGKAFLKFASDLSKYTEFPPMLQEALKRYLEILRCSAGSIYLWDESTETLVLEAAHGPECEKRVGIRQKLGEGLAGWVAEVGEPILVTDSRRVQKLRGRTERRYSNFSCIAVPITHGGQLFGVVCLTMPLDDQPFTAEHLATAQALSERFAAAIRPLSVLSELRRFSERLFGAFRSSADLVLERDNQVEQMRDVSAQILDSVTLSVIAYDRDLRVRSANLAARRLFGLQISHPHECGPLADGLDMDSDLWRKKLQAVISERREFRVQRVAFKGGEESRVLNINCSPLNDAEGNATGGILTVQDVTEDMEMENKLHAAERLALVGRIAAKVAHELNNPLDGILRFLSLATRQLDDPDKARSYMEESRRGLLRMSNILSQLLTFSRSHHGAHRPITYAQLIHQGLAQYEHRANEMNIDVRVNVPEALPLCERHEVWEVFGNVIKNALDAIDKDGELAISVAERDTQVVITIKDTGPGVPEDLQTRIFEPFFTTKKEGDGTGLGLAICRDSLRRIGGEIRLLPSDKGALFEIIVPTKNSSE